MKIKVSEATKVVDKLLPVIHAYAHAVAQWPIAEEDDYDDFKDALLDTIITALQDCESPEVLF